jgi:anti-sigma factor RsiW
VNDSLSRRGCDRARAQSSALLDGELSELEEADFRLHLDECAACRSYHADSASISRLLWAAPSEQLDYPIVVPRRRYVATRWIQAGSAAAAVLAAIGLGSAQGVLGGHGGLSSASSSSSPASYSPAYVQSVDYERHLLDSLRAPNREHTGSGVPL